jgi:hypothetical protein
MSDAEERPEQQEKEAKDKKSGPYALAAIWTKQKYEACKANSKRYAEKGFGGPWWFRQTDPIARFTGWVALFTLVLAGVAGLQTCVLSNQLTEMRAEQRPWISLVGSVATDLLYDKDGPLKGLPRLVLAITIKNIGHLPAQHVYSLGHLIPWIDADGPVRKRDALCRQLKDRKLTPETTGFTLLPNDVKVPLLSLAMQQDELQSWTSVENSVPVIAGCLDYVFVTDNSHHRLGFIFELDKHGASPDRPFASVRPSDGPIPKGNLMLDENPSLAWDID